tara:strand:- start:2062 stop:2415 length:354 start_codon:yes stop_codon:yes gene_type:complete
MKKENTFTCYGCNKELPIDSFHKNSARKQGHETRCKECRKKNLKYPDYIYYGHENEYSKQYRAEMTDEQKKNQREHNLRWSRANRDKTREYQRKYHQKYREENGNPYDNYHKKQNDK